MSDDFFSHLLIYNRHYEQKLKSLYLYLFGLHMGSEWFIQSFGPFLIFSIMLLRVIMGWADDQALNYLINN